jgi:hypothetical protein
MSKEMTRVYLVCYREMDHDAGDVRAVFSTEDAAEEYVVRERTTMHDPYGHASLEVEEWVVDEVDRGFVGNDESETTEDQPLDQMMTTAQRIRAYIASPNGPESRREKERQEHG